MREQTNTRKIVLAGLFVALGLIIPYFTGHAFGIPGTVLLPMHIPVLICGLLCGPKLGALCGLVTPLLSGLLTGMPPAYPMMPVMMGELMTYGLVTGLVRETFGKPILVAQIAAMAAGRVVAGIIFAALVFANANLKAPTILGSIITGLPGIAIQLALITPIVMLLEGQLFKKPANGQSKTNLLQGKALEEAKRLVQTPGTSMVLVKDDQIIYKADGRGVKPLLEAYETAPELMKGAVVVDKIIGKAAAMIAVLAEVQAVYGITTSQAGSDFLKKNGIEHAYDRKIDLISNREGSGICPLERSVLDEEDPQKGYEKLRSTIKELMKAQ